MFPVALSVHIEVSPRGISSLKFIKATAPGLRWTIAGDTCWNQAINEWMKAYAARRQPDLQLPFDLSALPSFSQLVLGALQEISFGEVLSYKEVAERLGKPRAARAVGNACGRNPVPLMIPCHRVIASDGGLGGFSLDPNIKTSLLAFEGAEVGTSLA